MLLLIIESLSGEPLIEEDYNSKKTAKERRRTALIAGTSVGLGAILLASLLVGGTLIATNGDSSKISLLHSSQIRGLSSMKCSSKTLFEFLSFLLEPFLEYNALF